MSLKEKTKNEIKKKFKKIVFKIIKPFIPFLIVIFLIVLAVCTVVDSMFTTEDDMQMAEKLSSEDYEAQYAEWLKDKELLKYITGATNSKPRVIGRIGFCRKKFEG